MFGFHYNISFNKQQQGTRPFFLQFLHSNAYLFWNNYPIGVFFRIIGFCAAEYHFSSSPLDAAVAKKQLPNQCFA